MGRVLAGGPGTDETSVGSRVLLPTYLYGTALGGLYLSLGPSLAAAATESPNAPWGGIVIFLLCGPGAAAAFVLRNIASGTAMLPDCAFMLVGVLVTFDAIATTTSATYLAGTAVAGLGFCVAFQGAFRRTTALAAPDQRAGLLAAIFAVAYLPFSIPVLIAGVATTRFGLHTTALVYSAVLVLLTAMAIGLMVFALAVRPPDPRPPRRR